METINRNNYEEYFLLYADNELDAASKLVVENFVQLNTDLAVELDMLIQTRLKPEEILFDDKEILLRTEGNSINETNYEEYFLLYIDNELSALKRAEVERYVLQHPALQNEFTTLKQAVLPVENISYSNKEDLYKSDKRRAIYFKPWQLAAAAIFIGVCAVGVWLMQKPAHINVVAETHMQQHQIKKNDEARTNNQVKANTSVTKPVDSIKQIQQPLQTETIAQQALPTEQKKIINKKTTIKKNDVVLPKNKEADVAEYKSQLQNEVHKTVDANDIVKQDHEPVTDNNDVAIETLPSNKKAITASLQNNEGNTADENNNGYKIYNIAYKEINPNDDDNSLHVGAFDLNKNKVKTLLKKAGRLFSSKQNNTTDDDGKLQIANFKINTINQ